MIVFDILSNVINKNELILVVDENNNPIEPKPRHEVHQNGYWHRTSHIWIVNSKSQVLCQKRSMLKDSSPGMWESFFGGHLPPGQEYLDGALVELNEELGITANPEDLKQIMIYKREAGNEFQGVFLLKWDGNISTLHPEKDEVDELKWVDISDLKSEIVDPNANWNLMGYEAQLLEKI